MKKILILILSIYALTANAQKSDLIIGKWIFKDAYNKDNVDKEKLDFMNTEIINKWSLVFKADGDFESHIMDESGIGKWKLDKDAKTIIITSDAGDNSAQFTILKSTESELALKTELGEFLMVKG